MRERLPRFIRLRRDLAAIALIAIAGCAQQPTYQVVNAPVARTGTVESVREVVEQKGSSGLGMIAGGLIGGGLGSLVGGGTGRTVATVVGALGGGYVGNELEQKTDAGRLRGRRQVRRRHLGDDSTDFTDGLRIGDRVVVTDNSIQLLGR